MWYQLRGLGYACGSSKDEDGYAHPDACLSLVYSLSSQVVKLEAGQLPSSLERPCLYNCVVEEAQGRGAPEA